MFGFFNNEETNFGAPNYYGWGSSTSNHEGYDARRQRNEQKTRDYFRGLYGADPVELGFEVPDWDWD